MHTPHMRDCTCLHASAGMLHNAGRMSVALLCICDAQMWQTPHPSVLGIGWQVWSGEVQTIQDGFQHEQPDYWLNFGNPWEIERLNIAYTIKFYGHVSVQDEGGRQTFKWNPGESVSQHSSVETLVP